jgi:hypothetical protein
LRWVKGKYDVRMGGRETWLRIKSSHGVPLSCCIDRETVTLFLAEEWSTWQEIKK